MGKLAKDLEIKFEKLRERVREGDYKTALDICNNIDFGKIVNENDLMMVSSIYEKNREYEKAKELLKRASKYSKRPSHLLYDLSFICIEAGGLPEAIMYYKEFCKNFPEDERRELLKYGILKRKAAPPSQLIRILEDYLSSDLDEKWLYELALQYERENNYDALELCCDKIVEMFGIDNYGKQALSLKQKYKPLSEYQKEIIQKGIIERNKEYEDKKINFDSQTETKEEQTVRKDTYTFDKNEIAPPQDITPKEEKEEEEENVTDLMFTNLPKTNVGIEDVYIPDTEEFFSQDSKTFSSAFANEDNEKVTKEETYLVKDTKEEENIENVKREESTKQEIEVKKLQELENRKSIINLSEEEKEMRLDNIKVNMIIEAMTREAGINIAKSELSYIRNAQGIKTGIAKTSAYNINDKGFDYYKEKILDNDLIIESAGRLTDRSIDDIEEFIINNGKKNIVCLIDIVNNFDSLVVKRPEFIKRFDIISDLNVKEDHIIANKEDTVKKQEEVIEQQNQHQEKKIHNEETDEQAFIKEEVMVEHKTQPIIERRVEIKEEPKKVIKVEAEQKSSRPQTKENDIEYFVTMCRNYASNIDCVIPGKSMQALYNKIEEMRNNNIPLTKDNAIALIEKAADRAEKPKFGFSKKYDKNDCLILKEEHFK